MKEVATLAANLMAASARTAPKAGGKDFLEIVVITDEGDLKRIAQTMKEYAPKSTNEAFWLRDADNIDNRVQQRVGAAARALGLIEAEVVMGVPVSISGKSIYFDRKVPAVPGH